MGAKGKIGKDGLNDGQKRFVEAYLREPNGTKAALEAGYSPKTAESQASRLLSNAKISAAIAQGRAIRAKRLDISADRVLLEVARLALFDPRKVLDADGRPKPISDLDDDAAAAIAGLDVSRSPDGSEVIKYKLADKSANLEKLMRHLGLYERDNEQSAANVAFSVNFVRPNGASGPEDG